MGGNPSAYGAAASVCARRCFEVCVRRSFVPAARGVLSRANNARRTSEGAFWLPHVPLAWGTDRDKSFSLHSSEDYLRVPGHCTAGRALLEDEEHIDSGWDVAFILVGGLMGSVVVGLLLLQLLRKAPMVAILLSTLSYGALFVIGGSALADNEADKSMPITCIILGAFLLLVPFVM